MPEVNRLERSPLPKTRSWHRRVPWWQLVLWATAAAAGHQAWLIQVQIDDVPEGSIGWWIFGGSTRVVMERVGAGCAVLLVLIPAVLTAIATAQARRAKQSAEEAKLAEAVQIAEQLNTTNGTIAPLAANLGRLAHLDPGDTLQRERLAGNAARVTFAGLFDLLGGSASGVRVCYFALEGVTPNRQLRPVDRHGRGRRSGCVIFEGDGGRGDDAFRALDAREPRIWTAGDAGEPPAGWNPDKEYKTFIAVPVATESVLFGMITLDAVDPHAFRKVHLPIVQTVAELYAAILAGLSAPKEHPDQSGATFE